MAAKTKAPDKLKPRATQQALLRLYRAFVTHLADTLERTTPGAMRPAFLAVVRLVIKDAGIMREVRTQMQARHEMEVLRGEVKGAEDALSLPFAPPPSKH